MKSLFVLLCLAPLTVSAFAGNVYDNGPVNGQISAWNITSGFSVTDSFTVSSGSSPVNGLNFYVWLFLGDTMNSVEVQLGTTPFGQQLYEATVAVTQSNCFQNSYGFDVCAETADLGGGATLNNGTYWLTLQNASVSNGDPAFWDENSGIGCQSPGCPSLAQENKVGTIPSEAFTLMGSGTTTTDVVTVTGTTPEPGSMILFGSGLLCLVGFLRRKLF